MLRGLAEKIVGIAPVRFQSTVRQFLKFGITGTIGAFVDFGTYNLLTRGFGLIGFYTVFGQKIIIANNFSVLLAIVSNFLLNKYWTFRDKGSNVAQQWTGYFVLNVFTWGINQLLVSMFIFQVPIVEAVFGSQKDNAAKALAIGIILFINFAGSKFIIFRKKPGQGVEVANA